MNRAIWVGGVHTKLLMNSKTVLVKHNLFPVSDSFLAVQIMSLIGLSERETLVFENSDRGSWNE